MGVRICSTILWKQINLPPLFFLNWLVVWISTCSPVLLHGQWVGTLRVILYCIHIDKYIYIQYIRYAYMNSSGEQEWSALPWGRVKVKSQIEISCVVFGCLTFCSIVIPPKIYIYIQEQKTGYYHFKVGIYSTYRLVAMTGWFQQISRGPQDRSLSGPAGGVKW